jgi:hypothetical protein
MNNGYGVSAFLQQRNKTTNRFVALFFAAWLLFCTNCHANEKAEVVMINRILDIVTYASTHGVTAAYQLLEEQLTFSKDSRTIQLQEKVENFGEGVADISVWTVGSFLPEKKGFEIWLPIDQRSYTSELSAIQYKVHECSGSHVSNGKKVWSISPSLLVTEEWSCGSLGCSFYFGFFENNNESTIPSKYCSIEY